MTVDELRELLDEFPGAAAVVIRVDQGDPVVNYRDATAYLASVTGPHRYRAAYPAYYSDPRAGLEGDVEVIALEVAS